MLLELELVFKSISTIDSEFINIKLSGNIKSCFKYSGIKIEESKIKGSGLFIVLLNSSTKLSVKLILLFI